MEKWLSIKYLDTAADKNEKEVYLRFSLALDIKNSIGRAARELKGISATHPVILSR